MLVPACFSGNRVVMCKRRPYCFQLKHCTVVSGYRMGEGNWSHCPRLLRAITWVKRFSCHCWYWYCTSQSALCISNSCIAHSEEEKTFERETLGWKLESLHCKCQRGLAFLESNATFRLKSDSSAGLGRLSKPSLDCNLEKERAKDWTQKRNCTEGNKKNVMRKLVF